MQKNSKELPHNVLVMRFSALGDVAMTIPVVYSVCRCNPGTRFIFLTKKSQASLFINPPTNLVVLGYDFKKDYPHSYDLVRLFLKLKKEYDIDAIADLHGVLRSFAISLTGRLHGVKVHTIRKGRRNKRALTRPRNKVMLPLISSRARYREVFYHFGFDMEERFTGLYGNEKADPQLFASIAPTKAEGEKWIGIAPFAKHKGKIYPLELMEKVVAELSALPEVKIFLFGGGDYEREVLARWAQTYPGVTTLADKKHGFPVELALQSYLDTMVTMDSANMHLASLVGVRVISIWGATHSYCGFKGYKQQESDIIQLPMPCRPCSVFGNKPCMRGDYYCLSAISPQTIIQKVKSIISIDG
jgi:ADP-heptose:LPS heptosyltransferase